MNPGDPENQDPAAVPALKRYGYAVLSFTCLVFFLLFLLVGAIVQSAFHGLTFHHKAASRADTPPYPATKHKLTPSVPYYMALLGLTTTRHTTITPDGFELELFRIANPGKPVILMVHGLLQHSGALVSAGHHSIALHLYRAGYEVWLGNNRCGFEPKHSRYHPGDPRMWDWDLTHMAKFDLPLLVSAVCDSTGQQQIHLALHSQGTLQYVMAAYLEKQRQEQGSDGVESLAAGAPPPLLDRLSSVTLLAPAVYAGPLCYKWYVRFALLLPSGCYRLMFGLTLFMPILLHLKHILDATPLYAVCCYRFLMFLFGWDLRLWDPRTSGINSVFAPVYVSARHMRWWVGKPEAGAVGVERGFLASDGCPFGEGEWFPANAPPMMLVVGAKDYLVDGARFAAHMEREPVQVETIVVDEWAHLDCLWAKDAGERVGGAMLKWWLSGGVAERRAGGMAGGMAGG